MIHKRIYSKIFHQLKYIKKFYFSSHRIKLELKVLGLYLFILELMMLKILFATTLVVSSAMAQSATPETQAIVDQIVASFNLNNLKVAEPSKFNVPAGAWVIDPQAHLIANLGSTNRDFGLIPTLTFKDNKSLAITVNQYTLSELTQNGDVKQTADGSLLMTAEAKSRLAFGAVNITGIVEARNVIIKNGVVILTGH